MSREKVFPSFLLMVALAGSACAPVQTRPTTATPRGKVWMRIEPMQCLRNPWEKDWLATHKNQPPAFFKTQEANIIKKFFKRKGVFISDVRVKLPEKGAPICVRCDCTRGDVLLVLVPESGIDVMTHYGFRTVPRD